MPFELIYQSDEDGEVYWLYHREIETMLAAGLRVSAAPSVSANRLLRRGLIVDEENFPRDPRYIQNGATFSNLTRIDKWHPIISDLTIPTRFCDQLDARAISIVNECGWSRCFVKNSVKSLVEDDPLDSVWPDVPFEVMLEKFSSNPRVGPYALREYLAPGHFVNERRYWVIGDLVHHSSGIIPEIVREAKKRLDVFGGVFYTIDATPELIVEINGGESSDRKTDNKAEDFARWIKEAFDR